MNKIAILNDVEKRLIDRKEFKNKKDDLKRIFNDLKWEEYNKLYIKLYKYFRKNKLLSPSEIVKNIQLKILKDFVDNLLDCARKEVSFQLSEYSEDDLYSKIRLETAERNFIQEIILDYWKKHELDFPPVKILKRDV